MLTGIQSLIRASPVPNDGLVRRLVPMIEGARFLEPDSNPPHVLVCSLE